MSSGENYIKLKSEIADLAIAHGRNPADISLVVVSKYHPWHEMLPIYNEGNRDFGENRVLDSLKKMQHAPLDVRWHMIGTIQSKKVDKVIGRYALIHSVDTPGLAELISKSSEQAGVVTSILLQVNTSGELSKHGLNPAGWKAEFESLVSLPGIRIEGFMTMAPFINDKDRIRRSFSRLRHLRDELSSPTVPLPHLSMGMSHDYPIAIAEGATILRIGTKIFS